MAETSWLGGENWLEELSKHPAFNSSSTLNQSIKNDKRFNKQSSSTSLPQSNLISIINQTDLIVYSESEIRLLSLAKFKNSLSSTDPNPSNGHQSSTYKVLRPLPPSAIPEGPITHLAPNPTSRLLAVCSSTQVSVICLPRPEEQADPKTHLDCNALLIGISGGTVNQIPQVTRDGNKPLAIDEHQVMKVLWHEWSYRASTILILYSTGIMHEYDVSSNSRYPTQVIDFNSVFGFAEPNSQELGERDEDGEEKGVDKTGVGRRMGELSSTPRDSRSPNKLKMITPLRKSRLGTPQSCQSNYQANFYGSPDLRSTTAVSMCFGAGSSDWGPLTLYGLMKNGDVYAICPYLPHNWSVSYILCHKGKHPPQQQQQQKLISYIQKACIIETVPLCLQNSLLLLLTAKSESISKSSKLTSTKEKSIFKSLEYLNLLFKLPGDSNFDPETELEGRDNFLNFFKSFKFRPIRHGPYLIQPSPIELDEEDEEEASDLIHLQYPTCLSEFDNLDNFMNDNNGIESVAVLMIAYNRRVDVCLEFQKVEPLWLPLDHGEDTVQGMIELPILEMYECIDLGIPTVVRNPKDNCPLSPLAFLRDPRYDDITYVFHRMGLHAISNMDWVEKLLKSFEEQAGTQSVALKDLDKLPSSEVGWIAKIMHNNVFDQSHSPCGVRGFSVINDAYLGYGLLTVTEDFQVVTQQLQLRPNPLTIKMPVPEFLNLKITNDHSYTDSALSQRIGFTKPLKNDSSSLSLYTSLLDQNWKHDQTQPKGFEKRIEEMIKRPENLNQVNSTTVRYAAEVSELLKQVYDCREKLVVESQSSRSMKKSYEERIERIERNQAGLLKRADLVLQRLTDEEEFKWIAEIGRMKAEIEGDRESKGLKSESALNRSKKKAFNSTYLSPKDLDEYEEDGTGICRGIFPVQKFGESTDWDVCLCAQNILSGKLTGQRGNGDEW
ncbi:hypothetical protein BY996DRAFT_6500232 [Phakopsora pachyrhizi]|nr:hypothetical protein BY996DRAFT_6500232 [Phakopsora pachyrhizi]